MKEAEKTLISCDAERKKYNEGAKVLGAFFYVCARPPHRRRQRRLLRLSTPQEGERERGKRVS